MRALAHADSAAVPKAGWNMEMVRTWEERKLSTSGFSLRTLANFASRIPSQLAVFAEKSPDMEAILSLDRHTCKHK